MGLIEDAKENKRIALTNDFKYIAGGESGEIYSPNKNIVIKIPLKNSYKDSCDIENDHNIQKELFNSGYCVPEPYGLVKAINDGSFPYASHLNLEKCLVMERIHGHDLEQGEYLNYDISSMKKEAEDIVTDIKKNTGLAPDKNYGLWNHNVMWDEINERIVIIDFENWTRDN